MDAFSKWCPKLERREEAIELYSYCRKCARDAPIFDRPECAICKGSIDHCYAISINCTSIFCVDCVNDYVAEDDSIQIEHVSDGRGGDSKGGSTNKKKRKVKK